ncbi:MAG: acylphosphatase [Deltaproteobacteria bacterium]|nr:MAG: acylphosphatase [Deltaproteobacteria bacterium]
MRDRVRAEVVVRGRVQGVFFRASAQQEGLRLGLTGEVSNLPDGSVEAIVEGEKEAVEDFVAWCRRGPPSAEVDDVQVKLRPPRDEFRTFTVAR